MDPDQDELDFVIIGDHFKSAPTLEDILNEVG
jgi:hypothetical protein